MIAVQNVSAATVTSTVLHDFFLREGVLRSYAVSDEILHSFLFCRQECPDGTPLFLIERLRSDS
jgi:hypothetical protein